MTHSPREGSIADRAIKHLVSIGGGPMKKSELARAIDAETESMHASTNLAVQHGLLCREVIHGLTMYWVPSSALPDREPSAADAPAEAEPAMEQPAAVWPSIPMFSDMSAGQAAAVIDGEQPLASETPRSAIEFTDEPAPAHAEASQIVTEPVEIPAEPRRARFALWSDGMFEIEFADGDRRQLQKEDAYALFMYSCLFEKLPEEKS